ncbi:terminase small subunit [Lactobacillus delbrueckii subsp. lactis]|uniref:terminase small subunit n=1 Tax=Lactobacillus delbrueckii TaxID=1584 RepID=UPI001E4C619D|nr:terminase small subunit [Lactobacillus delbrueckii]MCD5515769.1 terminase small subunit [Lactobacillus delbrueckii subsp. lactis]
MTVSDTRAGEFQIVAWPGGRAFLFQREVRKVVAVLKLTIKQKKFADEYIRLGNSTQAAIKAGYSQKTARQIGADNLSKVYIREYINKKMDALDKEKTMQIKEIMEELTSIARGELKEERLDKDGNIVETRPLFADRIKAMDMLGKRYGMWNGMAQEAASQTVIIDDMTDGDADEG